MPVVKANENPILLEEVLDEGLIDALRQGANYLKDRRTIRRFNRFAKDIQNSNAELSEDQKNKLKLKSYYAQKAQDRTNMFKDYAKDRFSKSGRANARMRKEMQTKLTGKEKQIMQLQDQIAENKKKPGYNEDQDPDIKKLQQLTNTISQSNPAALTNTMNNIRNYRKDQNKFTAVKRNDGSSIINPYDQRLVNRRKENESKRTDAERVGEVDSMLSASEERRKAEEEKIKNAKAEIERLKAKEELEKKQNNKSNQRPSQVKPVPDVNTATDNKNLNQQAKNQFNQASKAAYGNNRPVTAPAK